jgi:hypothetical protein
MLSQVSLDDRLMIIYDFKVCLVTYLKFNTFTDFDFAECLFKGAHITK